MPFKTYSPDDLFTTVDMDTYLVSQSIIRCTSGTRPNAPSEGWHIYETDTQRLFRFTSGEWKNYTPEIGLDRYAFKPADQTSSSTIDLSDPDLTLPVVRDHTYLWEAVLFFNSASNGLHLDLDFNIAINSWGVYSLYFPITGEEGNLDKSSFDTGGINMQGYVTTSGVTVRAMGALVLGNVYYDFHVKWRSRTGTAVTLKQHSYLRLTEIFTGG